MKNLRPHKDYIVLGAFTILALFNLGVLDNTLPADFNGVNIRTIMALVAVVGAGAYWQLCMIKSKKKSQMPFADTAPIPPPNNIDLQKIEEDIKNQKKQEDKLQNLPPPI